LHIKSTATVYSSTQKFDTLTTICIILVGLVMLLAPMWWLEYVSTSVIRLKIITGFIYVFIAIMSTATVNRPFEVVAAMAAYAAVLMVFMQSLAAHSLSPLGIPR
jgi:di/tricarboxylate transporter